ncbi:MAG: sulfurtransferase [Burkholderiales bacterium]|nr:MAG: sulfurtransferase [Burkholderiales bacterium]
MTTNASPLISAAELAQALRQSQRQGDQDWLVIDCRFNLANTQAGEAAYAQGHIAGALYAHLDRDLSSPKTGRNGRHPMPSPEAFERTARAWGIQPGTRVVAYDDAGGMFAARLWWLLRWAGFEAVQVLDGGWQAWLAIQGAVDTAMPARTASAFKAQPRADWVLSANEVLAQLSQSGQQLLIDARAPDRFRGENETMDPVGGHIPGARNRFFQHNLQADGRFKPAEQLKAEFDVVLAGAPLQTVVHQCGSGVTACHNLLAMAQAGLPATRLYAGSWSEWCADPARPIEH